MPPGGSPKTLVIGGLNGFVGSNVTEALVELGRDCVVTQHESSDVAGFLKRHIDRRVFVESADATSGGDLRLIGEKHRIEGIVDMAGVYHAGASSPIPDLKAYFDRVVAVLQAAEEWKVKRVTFSSSVGLYFGAGVGSGTEDMPLPLPSAYPLIAFQKVVEISAGEFMRGSGISTACVRLGGMFGPWQNPRQGSVVPRLVHAAAKGTPLSLDGAIFARADDEDEHWYVKDLAKAVAMLQTAERLSYGVYNVGPGAKTKNAEVLEAVKRVVPEARLQLPLGKSSFPPFPLMDVTRLRSDTAFAPSFDLESAIEDYVGWLRSGNPK